MKKIQILFFIVVLLGIVSCSNETPQQTIEISGLTEEVYFEQVGEIDSIGLQEHYELIIQKASEGNGDDDNLWLNYAQQLLDSANEYQEECINLSGANWDVESDGGSGKNKLLGYHYTTIRYKSIDHKGNPIMLSTLVVWPYNNILSDPDANNIIIGCHCTITSNKERPTNYSKNSIMTDVGMLACSAKSNGITQAYENLVIIPDYQGYGATHGEPHPYLSQDITARQVLDGVKAGIAYYKFINHNLENDWRSVSVGYSQGGSVAMAVHKYIEKNNLEKEFNFAGSVCGAGPYDPIATLKEYISLDKVYMPIAAIFMMKSMCSTNPRLMDKYTPEDYLTQPVLDAGLLEIIDEKTQTTDDITEIILNYSAQYNESDTTTLCMYRKASDDKFYPYRKDTKDKHKWESGYGTSYAKTSDILRPEIINSFNGKTDAIYKEKIEALTAALNDNVLYKNWNPKHPIFVIHSTGDEVVPFVNYTNCLDAWENTSKHYVAGIRYAGATQSHVAFGKYFYLFHEGMAIVAIFTNTISLHMFDRTDVGI